MPYYLVQIKEKGRGGKQMWLPDPVFAPCVGEAWDEAAKVIPKGTTIVDVMPEEEKKRKR